MHPIANSTDHKDRQHLRHANANARLHEDQGALEIAFGDDIWVIDRSGKRHIEVLTTPDEIDLIVGSHQDGRAAFTAQIAPL